MWYLGVVCYENTDWSLAAGSSKRLLEILTTCVINLKQCFSSIRFELLPLRVDWVESSELLDYLQEPKHLTKRAPLARKQTIKVNYFFLDDAWKSAKVNVRQISLFMVFNVVIKKCWISHLIRFNLSIVLIITQAMFLSYCGYQRHKWAQNNKQKELYRWLLIYTLWNCCQISGKI